MGVITITEIRQKPKRSVIITADGKQYGCWTDKLGKLGLEQGASYNVETDTFEADNGKTLFNIISAKRVTVGASITASEPSVPRTSGQNSPVGSPSPNAPFRTPEQMFVEGVVTAYIGNGRCDPEKLTEIVGFVRKAWNSHWGEAQKEAA